MILLGAGGAAKSVLFGLKKLGVNKVFLYDLSITQAESLQKLAKLELSLEVTLISKEQLDDALSETPILINTTPVGMKFHQQESIIKNDKLFKGC